MKILITAPSLNELHNVSGVSSVVRTIVQYKSHTHLYEHFQIGLKDGEKKRLKWAIDQLTLIPRLLQFIRKKGVQIIHLNTDFTKASVIRDFLLVKSIKRLAGKPILLHVHGGFMLMSPPARKSVYGRLIAGLLKSSDRVLVLSKAEQEMLHSQYGVESIVLPNAVAPVEDVSEKNFYQKIHFIFIGKIVRTKGIFLITDALKRLSEHFNCFTFTIYGTGPDKDLFLSSLREVEGLDFSYKGVARGKEKVAAFANANVFLLPSYSEGLPMAMLEAMQMGCIPVVCDEETIKAVVHHKINGFIVKKGSSGELYAELKSIIEDRKQLNKISLSAIETIRTNYNITDYMKALAANYASLSK